jgi:hypothetical protein
MRNNYKNRKNDFKRRTISRIYTSMEDLVKEEQKWLNLIKKEECGIKYYNISLNASSPTMTGKKHSEETKEKMRLAATGKKHSEETKEKLRDCNINKIMPLETREKISNTLISNNKKDKI